MSHRADMTEDQDLLAKISQLAGMFPMFLASSSPASRLD
jgi:hypothetical protein